MASRQPIGALAIWKNALTVAITCGVFALLLSLLVILVRILRKNKPQSVNLSLRAKLEIYLAYTHIGEMIEFIQVAFSILSVILFIYGTYLDANKPPTFYLILELILVFFFILHWALDFFVSKDKLRYLFSFFSIIDMICVTPILIDLQSGDLSNLLNTFQFLRVLRVIRILRLQRVLHYFKNGKFF
ncbi:hypothetical protein DICPUDRAFT_89839 [Dictyostelium purpureum]|uniref:Ion transport domain-containing protein n=1 Tax=Dictyostelium purpureum TaxID=5786 RepID=F0ZYH3_DICPU|nr:uncharacterized protein DICPUDRAFT_89839 [Dictyostelium purpureum]EGC30995.1 hypothetical protein DICPUDRAFT_89839 [Dictyostelium purpureum]|eukprot:XP_003292465.1 hypothetical protein DICPUDRAFT_89839 [Dictyostelium purpureum]